MIQKDYIENLLLSMNYKKVDQLYERYFSIVDSYIKVDFNKEKIIYPEDKGITIAKKTTCNFSDPENFVVLECITRLLDKGYRPEHITLEKEWTLGHDAKGGRADICVSDQDNNMLFIIECKTYGREYDKELKNTINDGGQLFSYWQQERSCKFLVLYASKYENNEIKYETESIDCSDDANIVALSKKDETIKLFKDAYTVAELYSVWDETYEKRFSGNVIFRDDSSAYQIGVKPLRKSDLKDFTDNDKIVNKFEEILRHNNVSDKENAFNRLVALFICKLVDEIQKDSNEIVDFQYKIGTDTYESLQDRLQRLHKEGMEKFMKEEIFYVPDNYAEELVQQYTGQKRKNMISQLKQTLRILKFYTNNDFAFKDVHNEELFLQNGKILVEVVQLFENFRIIGSENLQMLGDLFEQLLNKGFKQNEGQFFTPVPITRFIWNSLPIEKILKTDSGLIMPKIIDYACGAGHFLTEGFEAIADYVSEYSDTNIVESSFAEKNIFGIEKDYRLARVSKISLFMHGAGEGNIIFGDGLENYPDKNIKPNSFDILVANPPYSVSAFKPHLKIKNNSFSILNKISNSGSEIETLFVERIAQLLKPNGVAAVILPSSILNKENESFIAARESILENFKLKAIVLFGSKTFGATGTNTVVLFIEKYNEPPKRVDLIEDGIDAILGQLNLDGWEDKTIIKQYLKKINVSKEIYDDFINENTDINNISNKYFLKYKESFLSLSTTIAKQKQKTFKKLSEDEQDKWLTKQYYQYAKNIEREKLKYFSLIYNQRTLIVVAPDDNKEQEKFLGYKWSNRKGQEGIQIIEEGGKLYDSENRISNNKVSSLIRNMFSDEEISIEDIAEHYYYLNTKDMINFSDIGFNKAISTAKSNVINMVTRKFKQEKISNIIDINKESYNPSTVPDKEFHYVDISSINDNKVDFSNIVTGNSAPSRARRVAKNGDVIISTVRPNLKGFAYLENVPNNTLFSTGFAILSSKDESILLNRFIYTMFMEDDFLMEQIKAKMGKGSYPSINQNDIKNFNILLPSIEEQKQIIFEFELIHRKLQEQELRLQELDKSIKSKFVEQIVNDSNIPKKKLGDIFDISSGGTPSRRKNEYWDNGTIPWVKISDMKSMYLTDTEEYITELGLSESSAKLFTKGTFLLSIFATLGEVSILDTDATTNQAIAGMYPKMEIDVEYTYIALTQLKERILEIGKGVAQNNINLTILKNLEIPMPDKEKRESFSEFVRQSNKLKFDDYPSINKVTFRQKMSKGQYR